MNVLLATIQYPYTLRDQIEPELRELAFSYLLDPIGTGWIRSPTTEVHDPLNGGCAQISLRGITDPSTHNEKITRHRMVASRYFEVGIREIQERHPGADIRYVIGKRVVIITE
ncbi:MAG: hypothetical protein GF368_00795 [Candidatus Aenigmarchaeota archaeon]|nr:hypothetical protein [Candidatus Aenigmarchaeota archaeon]